MGHLVISPWTRSAEIVKSPFSKEIGLAVVNTTLDNFSNTYDGIPYFLVDGTSTLLGRSVLCVFVVLPQKTTSVLFRQRLSQVSIMKLR
jgi:hypothetical protein